MRRNLPGMGNAAPFISVMVGENGPIGIGEEDDGVGRPFVGFNRQRQRFVII